MQELVQLFKQWCGENPTNIESLPQAGSNRKYIRFTCPPNFPINSVIGVIGTSVAENKSFIYLSQHFRQKGLRVPDIMAVSNDKKRYLQTDLGRCSLYSALSDGREKGSYSQEELSLIMKTIRQLPLLQVTGAQGLDFNQCLQPTPFDATAALFDLNYFKYCFLLTTDLEYNELKLEKDFQQLAHDLAVDKSPYFLYRDFQARNVMLYQGEPYFIDYQGGRKGPLYYDVVSFLWQASARYSSALRKKMIAAYLEELQTLLPNLDKEKFYQKLHLFALFRVMQVLGAYGFRGYFEKKKYFIDSIPPALDNLRDLLSQNVASTYPYLEEILNKMCALSRFNILPINNGKPTQSPFDNAGKLRIRIFSFSYKKGIPEDTSGNGGGYVFDCRSTHNPGRYEPYKKLTGLDAPVIKFLEDDGEILTFLDSVYKLADAHVKRYLERGFTNLMFSFGCTGGQHRSVYCAEHLAHHLYDKFGIEITVCHREQCITRTFKSK